MIIEWRNIEDDKYFVNSLELCDTAQFRVHFTRKEIYVDRIVDHQCQLLQGTYPTWWETYIYFDVNERRQFRKICNNYFLIGIKCLHICFLIYRVILWHPSS